MRSNDMISALDDGKGDYGTRKTSLPKMFSGAALVRVRSTGICGSDLHMTNERTEAQTVPTGHELAGEIVEMPSTGTNPNDLQVGDRVALEIIGAGLACGSCFYCRFGEFRHCLSREADTGGGFAEYVTRRPLGLFKLTDDMDWTDGALVEPIAVCVHALRFGGGMRPGETVAVVGSATIGLSAILVANAFGAKQVIASARHPHQAEAALRMGASKVVGDAVGELEEACREVTGGKGADTVVETVGGTVGDTLKQAVQCARPLGKVLVVGGFRKPVSFNFLGAMLREVRILLPVCYSNRDGIHDFEIALDLLSDGKSPYRSIVTHHYGLSDIMKGFADAYDKGTKSIKVHIDQF